MRRCIAILFVLTFSWLLILPALAFTTAASDVPACCRKNGKHHCQMKVTPGFAGLSEKCPYGSHNTLAVPNITFHTSPRQSSSSYLVSRPTLSAQAEAGYRVSYYRAKQKRGPPSFLS